MSSPVSQPRTRRGLKRGIALIVVALLTVAATAAASVLTSAAPAERPPVQEVTAGTSGTAYCPVLGRDGEAVKLEIASASAAEDSQIVITRFVDGTSVSDDPRLLEAGRSAVFDIPDDQVANPIAIEWRGAPVVAQYRKTVEDQEGVANCQTQPSDRWYLAGFDTNRGNDSTVYLFNPFGQDAVVQLRFGTPEGRVDLVIADEISIPAGRVVARDLAEFLPETADLAVTVVARVGRVIAQGQVVRGPAGEGLEAITGRALIPAIAAPSEQLFVPAAPSDDVVQSWLTLYNPSDRAAAVQVQVTTPLATAAALTTELDVPAGGTTRVELADLSALPLFGVRLDSLNSVGLIATQSSAIGDGSRAGLALQAAVPTTDQAWIVPTGQSSQATLTLFNPGDQVATAQVQVAGEVPPQWQDVAVPPNGLTTLSVEGIEADGAALVTSDVPLVAGVQAVDPSAAGTLWSTSGIAKALLAGGRDANTAQRDASLASRPAVSATATPTPLPQPDSGAEEGRLDPAPSPSIIDLPSATPTPSPGPQGPRPSLPVQTESTAPQPTAPQPTPPQSTAGPTGNGQASPSTPSSTEEGSLFGTIFGA